MRGRADIYTCGHRVALVRSDMCVQLLPDRSHGNTARTMVPNCGAPRLLRTWFQSSNISRTLFQTTDMTNYLTEHNYTADSNIYFSDVGNSMSKITKSAQLMQI